MNTPQWKVEHVNRNGHTSRAIVNGENYAAAKKRAAEIGLKPTPGTRFFAIVQITELSLVIPVPPVAFSAAEIEAFTRGSR